MPQIRFLNETIVTGEVEISFWWNCKQIIDTCWEFKPRTKPHFELWRYPLFCMCCTFLCKMLTWNVSSNFICQVKVMEWKVQQYSLIYCWAGQKKKKKKKKENERQGTSFENYKSITCSTSLQTCRVLPASLKLEHIPGQMHPGPNLKGTGMCKGPRGTLFQSWPSQ